MDSPYQPPASTPPPIPLTAGQRPATLRVFGTLNLLMPFIVIGGIAVLVFFSKASSSAHEKISPLVSALYAAYFLCFLLVTVLILISGWMMVKGHRTALRWANGYAILSLASKVAMCACEIAIVIPQRLPGLAREAASEGRLHQPAAHFIGALILFLTPVIYPALELIFINQRTVKNWLQTRPH